MVILSVPNYSYSIRNAALKMADEFMKSRGIYPKKDDGKKKLSQRIDKLNFS